MLALRFAYALFIGVCYLLGVYKGSTLDSKSLSEVYGTSIALVLSILVAPIVEEFAFRGWMTKNRSVIVISLAIAGYFFSTLTINIMAPAIGSIKYIVTISLTLALLFYSSQVKSKIADFISRNEILLKRISIAMFAVIHATNYEFIKFDLLTLSSLLVILIYYPFSAIILTHTRTKIGLIWSIALHTLTNSLMLINVYTGDYLP